MAEPPKVPVKVSVVKKSASTVNASPGGTPPTIPMKKPGSAQAIGTANKGQAAAGAFAAVQQKQQEILRQNQIKQQAKLQNLTPQQQQQYAAQQQQQVAAQQAAAQQASAGQVQQPQVQINPQQIIQLLSPQQQQQYNQLSSSPLFQQLFIQQFTQLNAQQLQQFIQLAPQTRSNYVQSRFQQYLQLLQQPLPPITPQLQQQYVQYLSAQQPTFPQLPPQVQQQHLQQLHRQHYVKQLLQQQQQQAAQAQQQQAAQQQAAVQAQQAATQKLQHQASQQKSGMLPVLPVMQPLPQTPVPQPVHDEEEIQTRLPIRTATAAPPPVLPKKPPVIPSKPGSSVDVVRQPEPAKTPQRKLTGQVVDLHWPSDKSPFAKPDDPALIIYDKDEGGKIKAATIEKLIEKVTLPSSGTPLPSSFFFLNF